jgi:hypothetical protein
MVLLWSNRSRTAPQFTLPRRVWGKSPTWSAAAYPPSGHDPRPRFDKPGREARRNLRLSSLTGGQKANYNSLGIAARLTDLECAPLINDP